MLMQLDFEVSRHISRDRKQLDKIGKQKSHPVLGWLLVQYV